MVLASLADLAFLVAKAALVAVLVSLAHLVVKADSVGLVALVAALLRQISRRLPCRRKLPAHQHLLVADRQPVWKGRTSIVFAV